MSCSGGPHQRLTHSHSHTHSHMHTTPMALWGEKNYYFHPHICPVSKLSSYNPPIGSVGILSLANVQHRRGVPSAFLVMLAEKETEMVFLHKDVCFPFRRSAVLQDGEVGGGGKRPQEHGAGVEVIVWVTVFRVWGGLWEGTTRSTVVLKWCRCLGSRCLLVDSFPVVCCHVSV